MRLFLVIVPLLATLIGCGRGADGAAPDPARQAAHDTDQRRLRADLAAANRTSSDERDLIARSRREPGNGGLRHRVAAMRGDGENLARHTPPYAIAVGATIPGDRGPRFIRDINIVTQYGVPWGFLYRTSDGAVFLQRNAAVTGDRIDPLVALSDVTQFPYDAAVDTLRTGDVQLAGTGQIIRANPRANESAFVPQPTLEP